MKTETKQTAVEWFIQQLKTQDGTYRGFSNIQTTHEKLIEQAKEMDKEQHKKTYNQSFMSNFQTFEDYYNETYGGNK